MTDDDVEKWKALIATAEGVPRGEWVALVRVLREGGVSFAGVRTLVHDFAEAEYDAIYEEVLSINADCHPTPEHVAAVRTRLGRD